MDPSVVKVETGVEVRGRRSDLVIVVVYSVQPGESGTLGPLLVLIKKVVGAEGDVIGEIKVEGISVENGGEADGEEDSKDAAVLVSVV